MSEILRGHLKICKEELEENGPEVSVLVFEIPILAYLWFSVIL